MMQLTNPTWLTHEEWWSQELQNTQLSSQIYLTILTICWATGVFQYIINYQNHRVYSVHSGTKLGLSIKQTNRKSLNGNQAIHF